MEGPVELSASVADGSGAVPRPSRRLLVLLAGVTGVIALLWFGRDILTPFIVGLLIVYLLDPVVERLARIGVAGRRVPRALLILLVYAAVTFVVVEVALLLVGPFLEQVGAFGREVPAYLDALNVRLRELLGWWDRLDMPANVREIVDRAVVDLLANVGALVPGFLRPVFTGVLGLVGSIFGFLIIPVWTFWVLKDRPALVRGFDRSIPAPWRADTWATLGIVRRVFGSWIRAQLILGLVVGVATFLGLLVLGALVDPVFSRYAVLLAVLAGVLELLPIIGPIIAAIPAVLLGATAGVPGIVAALVLYLVVQQLENNVLVPKIQGDATNLHPAVVIFALLVGGSIAGLLGAILALPIAATLRDLYVYSFRRADGQSPEEAVGWDARRARDPSPPVLEHGAGEAAGVAAAQAASGPASVAPAEAAGGPAEAAGDGPEASRS